MIDEAANGDSHDHLAPEGTLGFRHYLPNDDPKRWLAWVSEERERLPERWPEEGMRKQAANGAEFGLRARVIDLDRMEQRLTLEMRADLWCAGRLEEQEEWLLQENQYFRNEPLQLLSNAGFVTISVRAGYSAEEVKADDTMLVLVAQR